MLLQSSNSEREKVLEVVAAILKRGNDAEIRRKGDGYIVLEVTQKPNTNLLRDSAQERAIRADRLRYCSRLALLFAVTSALTRGLIQKSAICKPKSADGTVTATT